MRYRVLHKWDVAPKKAINIQRQLAKMILLKNCVKKINFIAGVDVSFKDEKTKACIYVMKYPELRRVECRTAVCKTNFPYIPGLLTFREGPAILRCVKKLTVKPDIFLFDGQGIAHPRKLGIAAHMGIILDTSSIGCAKSFLYGRYKGRLGAKKGSFIFLEDKGNKIGIVLRSRDSTRPIYVSPGHKIDLPASIEVVLRSLTIYRIPEPLRMAHHYAIKKVSTS